MKSQTARMFLALALAVAASQALAQATAAVSSLPSSSVPRSSGAESPRYRLQPGDMLTISVWKEKDLQAEVLIRPDGGLSFPLAGDLEAEGLTMVELQDALSDRLKRYIPDPVVSVAIKQIGGNQVYVIGKVNHPGIFAFSKPVDVMQALTLAGGATPFAALNDIVILRRHNGVETVIRFRYGDVERGRGLQQNVLLESGDTVVVP